MTPTQQRYRPLEQRFALLTSGLTLTLLLASGGFDAYFQYLEARERIEAVQAAQAEGAAREIATYLGAIESGLRDVAKLAWGRPGFDATLRREEFYRLMTLVPAIIELQAVDAEARETLFVTKHALDRIGSQRRADEPSLPPPAVSLAASQPLRYGHTFFRDGHLPTLRMSAPDGLGAIIATVDLRLLNDVVSRLKTGEGGLAYIVDAQGLLIAHPRDTHVLRNLDLTHAPAVAMARSHSSSRSILVRGIATMDLERRPVIATGAAVGDTGWIVFMEQQRDVALKPVWGAVSRTLLLMAVGGVLAVAIGMAFARRMAAPIVALRQATARIANGDLRTEPAQMPQNRHDEIEDLAQDFNRMLERLREVYASLEAKVTDRTAELSLRKDEAERANAAKTRFLAAASHDLRQPMHSISLLLGVLQSRLGSPEHLALADKIQSSVATMENLFGNLLDISKLDAGAVQAHVEDVDLGWLLHRLEQTWAPQAAEKGLRLSVRGCNVVVKGDAVLLERIAGNLVANAIRYTRQGGVLVGCRRRGSHVELQVWDSGPGIAPRYREAIFEEFFRIEAPGTTQEKGLGLGLSIVQRCAHILGYELGVDSRVGHGTVFSLTMPLATTAALPRPSPRLAASQQALEGRFIVVVDDETTNAQALVDALHACRCHVVAAASCDDVLAELQQHLRVPDLIVTDYQLGAGRDGFEVISRLRAHYDDAIPALMVTANTDASLQARAGVQHARLLHKPIGLQRLLEAMQASLDA